VGTAATTTFIHFSFSFHSFSCRNTVFEARTRRAWGNPKNEEFSTAECFSQSFLCHYKMEQLGDDYENTVSLGTELATARARARKRDNDWVSFLSFFWAGTGSGTASLGRQNGISTGHMSLVIIRIPFDACLARMRLDVHVKALGV
jgi:hypothetical protein